MSKLDEEQKHLDSNTIIVTSCEVQMKYLDNYLSSSLKLFKTNKNLVCVAYIYIELSRRRTISGSLVGELFDLLC